MGALAHYLEDEGVPTTQISLVREHTVRMRPPRALWVPFELGRPMGTPDEPAFQRRVLQAALVLLEAESGPVLADFPEEAPEGGVVEGWACPVSFAPPAGTTRDLKTRLIEEIAQLKPWHDLWRERRGRSTVGASGLDVETAAAYVAGFLDQTLPESPCPELSTAELLKLALEDLKAFYLEAAMAQPGTGSSGALADWLWGETVAGELMLALRSPLEEHPDRHIAVIAQRLLVPQTQLWRLDEKVAKQA